MEKQKWLNELAEFIVEGNRNAWAAGKGSESPRFPGAKSLYYKRGEWELFDDYSGYFRAPGFTHIHWKNRPGWAMAYGGTGQIQGHEDIVKPTFRFLREALMQVTPAMPFRGPSFYSDGTFLYEFELLSGDITDFLGKEAITVRNAGGDRIFEQIVLGGIVRHRDEQIRVVEPWEF